MANYIGYNTGEAVMPGFNFILRVEMAQDCPCRAIKGLRRENEFDYIQEGGLNDYVHMKRKPISRPFTFQVERYAGIDYLDPLALGTELALPLLLMVYDRPVLSSVSNALTPHRTYVFTGCTVTAKDYGDLNAESSGLVVETTTIAFRQMACIDNFVKAATDDWMTTTNKGDITNAKILKRNNTVEREESNEKKEIRNNSKGGEVSFIRPNFEDSYEAQVTTYNTEKDGEKKIETKTRYKYQKGVVDKSGKTSNEKTYERNNVDTSKIATNEKIGTKSDANTAQTGANEKLETRNNVDAGLSVANLKAVTRNNVDTAQKVANIKAETRNNVDTALKVANIKAETRNNVDTTLQVANIKAETRNNVDETPTVANKKIIAKRKM